MMNQTVAEAKTESVDVKEYLAVLLKRKWLILVCFLLSMAGTTAFLFTRQPIYRANLKLLVTVAGRSLPAMDVYKEDDRVFFGTTIDVMKSPTMLKRVQQRLRKTSDEIRENLNNLNIRVAGGASIIVISVDSPSREFARDFANALAEEYMRFREEQRAQSSENALLMLTREINRLGQELKSAEERYLTYAKEHNLSQLQATMATWNRATESDVIRYRAAKRSLARRKMVAAALDSANVAHAMALLNEAAEEERTEVAHAPSAAENPSTAGTSVSNIGIEGHADETNSEITQAEGQGFPAEIPATDPLAAATETSGELGAKAAPETVEPPLVQSLASIASLGSLRELVASLSDLEQRRITLEGKIEQLSKIYKPRHPALSKPMQDIEAVERKMQIQLQFAREFQTAQIRLLEAELDTASSELKEAEARGFELNQATMRARILFNEMTRVRSQYNALLSQLMKIDVAQSFQTRTISVLEQASAEGEPIYPKKMKGLMVAAFFGIGLGLALAFFIEYIDDSIKLAEEVERDLQLPFLGMIPAAQWSPDDLTAHRLDKLKQQGGVAESYRVVRSAIIFSTPREKLRSILLTSAVPREGKTTTCVNLSIGFAQIEERVLLVDADLRRGEVHKYFEFEREKGLSDVLLGEMTPEQAVRHTNVPKLDVITCGAYPANPAELLLGWRLKELLEWAYKNYDRVIIDCTPVMGIADSAILGSAVDGCLFVIWAGRTSRRYVRVAKMTAVSRGAKIFGFVLNNLEPGRVGYYHYYPYYYSYYSRGYYYARPDDSEAGKGGDVKGIEVPSPEGGEEKIDDVY